MDDDLLQSWVGWAAGLATASAIVWGFANHMLWWVVPVALVVGICVAAAVTATIESAMNRRHRAPAAVIRDLKREARELEAATPALMRHLIRSGRSFEGQLAALTALADRKIELRQQIEHAKRDWR